MQKHQSKRTSFQGLNSVRLDEGLCIQTLIKQRSLNYTSCLGGDWTAAVFLCDEGAEQKLHSSSCGANQQKSFGLWLFLPPSRCHKMCRSLSYQLRVIISFEVWKNYLLTPAQGIYITSIGLLHVYSLQLLCLVLAVFFFFFLSLTAVWNICGICQKTQNFFFIFQFHLQMKTELTA